MPAWLVPPPTHSSSHPKRKMIPKRLSSPISAIMRRKERIDEFDTRSSFLLILRTWNQKFGWKGIWNSGWMKDLALVSWSFASRLLGRHPDKEFGDRWIGVNKSRYDGLGRGVVNRSQIRYEVLWILKLFSVFCKEDEVNTRCAYSDFVSMEIGR